MDEPKLRFHKEDGSEYPDWKTAVFGSIMTPLSNNTLSRSELSSDGRIKNIHYGDVLIKYPSILNASCQDIPFIKDENKAKAKQEAFLRTGDIVIADTAEDETVGKAVELIVHNEHVLAGLHTMAFRPVERLFWPGFLGYYINSPAYHNSLRALMQGIKVTSISKSEVVKTMVSIPSVEEQHKIADFLSAVDDKIALKRKKYEALLEAKKGLLQKIFSQEIRFRKDGDEEYPEWEIATFNNCLERGKAGGTPKSTVSDYYGGTIPFLSISDMTESGKIVRNTEKSLTEKGLVNSSAWIIPAGSIILSMYASYGKVCYNAMELATSQALFGILLKASINKEFIYQSLCYLQQIHYWDQFIRKGTQPNINAEIIRNANVLLPCIEEQQKIADFLSAFDDKIEAVRKELEGWKTVKKGLLQQMFC